MSEVQRFDAAIIGGGSGLTAAYHALEDGKSVALIDAQPEALGGTCINRGCIPTKGLTQSANVMAAIRSAGKFGIELDQSSVKPDFAKIMGMVRERRREQAGGVRKWVEEKMTPFFGRAAFVEDKVIEMEDGRRVTAEKLFLCTGARPAVPPIDGIGDVPYLTNESALELNERPRSLVIVGGGYIGCEFGHFFSSMGTDVTVIDPDPDRLLSEDHDIGDVFTEAFGKNVKLELNSKAIGVERNGDRVVVTIETSGQERQIEADAIMIAAGRAPNTEGLGLEKTGVETSDKGWIRVDEHLRTSHPDIYAYGDCTGQEMFKHTSSYEGRLAWRNSQGGEHRVDYSANPHAVFGDPEIGSVGLTERQCRERGLDYQIAKVEYANLAKGEILGSPPGLAKAIVEAGSRKILGFHLAGPHAAILIHEVVLAMSVGGTAQTIQDAIHVHPSMPELVAKVFGKL